LLPCPESLAPNGILGVDLRRIRPATNRVTLVGWCVQVMERMVYKCLADDKPRAPETAARLGCEGWPGVLTGGETAFAWL
ncbi:MAG: hypothetical protein V3W34_02495, partial [Phycisphaerae bacterium]